MMTQIGLYVLAEYQQETDTQVFSSHTNHHMDILYDTYSTAVGRGP